MQKLHKRENTTDSNIEPNEGERTLLCSNEGGMRSPSLDLGISSDSTEDELISILADILVEGFLWQFEHGKEYTKQGGNLLPGINLDGAKDLYNNWSIMPFEEKRGIVELITNWITIGKSDINISLSYLSTPALFLKDGIRNRMTHSMDQV